MNDAAATVRLQRLSPGDLALQFENFSFTVRDQRTGRSLAMTAWWIPRPASTRCVLLIHGYADAKVGAIAWAPLLHSLGWNILAVDLRAHGESEGQHSTAGFYERHDVEQIINQIRADRPDVTRHLIIFGVSLGAAVAVAAAADRDDVDALILESPFGDYRRAIAAHGHIRGLPGGWMRDAAITLAERIAVADFCAVRAEVLIGKVRCPVLVIRSGDDPFVPDADGAEMAAAVARRGNSRDDVWTCDGAGHVLGLAHDPAKYQQRIGHFLDAALAVHTTANEADA